MSAKVYKISPPSIAKLLGSGVACVLDGDMDALADRSAFGQQMVPSASGVSAALGPYGTVARRLNGVNNGGGINCGSAASLDVVGNISHGCWFSVTTKASGSTLYYKSDLATTGYLVEVCAPGAGVDGRIRVYTGNPLTNILGTANLFGTGFRHVIVTNTATVRRLFVDGLQDNRDGGTHTDYAAGSLIFGTYYPQIGGLDQPLVCAQALSPQQIYEIYKDASRRPTFYDDLKGYPVDFAARSAGSEIGPFRIVDGTHQITVDSSGEEWVQCVTAGNLKGKWADDSAYGTWEFDFSKTADATYLMFAFLCNLDGSRSIAGQNGYTFTVDTNESLAIGLLTNGSVVSNICATGAGYIALGTKYTARIVRRIGGSVSCYIKGGVYPDWTLIATPAVQNSYTTGNYSAIQYGAAVDKLANFKRWLTCNRPANFPWEYVSGTRDALVSSGLVWKRTLTAEICFVPKDRDYAQGRRGFRTVDQYILHAAGGVTDTILAEELTGSLVANQQGYVIRITATGRSQWIRTNGVGETIIAETADGFISDGLEYQRRVTHNDATGLISVYYKGAAYTDWTLATSVVSLIYPTMNYWFRASRQEIARRVLNSAIRCCHEVRNSYQPE